MSSVIFPLTRLPLASRTLRRVTGRSVPLQRAENGKTYPIRRQLAPRRRWAVDFGPMSEAAGEVAELARFAAMHGGRYDTFLLRDPADYQVSGHGFGVGDGATTGFQLQRALAGSVANVLGSWALQTKRRVNAVASLANWTLQGAGTGSGLARLTANAGVAPDGTPTASRLWLDRGSGNTSSDYSLAGSGVGSIVAGSGVPYAGSIFMRSADGLTHTVVLRLGDYTTLCVVTSTWQRFQVVKAAGGTDLTALTVWVRGGGMWGGTDQTADLLLWRPVVDPGALAALPPMDANTTGTLAMVPAYWPAVGDGFEPVTEPGPDLAITLDADGLGLRTLSPVARTNMLVRSEEFNDAAWSRSNATVTANAAAGPDGTAAVADLLVENTTATVSHYAKQEAALIANERYTKSVHVRRGSGTRNVYLQARRADGLWTGCGFDLSTGLAVTPTNCLAQGAIACGGGWWRVWMTFSSGAGTPSNNEAIFFSTDGTNAGTTYTGDGTSGLYLWGAQTEVGGLGDYIPTTTTTVTRTDYTLGAGGQVTFAVAPRGAPQPTTQQCAQLAWSGSFYRRVRFAGEEAELERIAAGLWRSGRIELEEEPA